MVVPEPSLNRVVDRHNQFLAALLKHFIPCLTNTHFIVFLNGYAIELRNACAIEDSVTHTVCTSESVISYLSKLWPLAATCVYWIVSQTTNFFYDFRRNQDVCDSTSTTISRCSTSPRSVDSFGLGEQFVEVGKQETSRLSRTHNMFFRYSVVALANAVMIMLAEVFSCLRRIS